MWYLYILFLILFMGINTLSASLNNEFKHNFFIEVGGYQSSISLDNNQNYFIKNESSYSFGYLIQKNKYYLGISYKRFPKGFIQYSIPNSNQQNINVNIKKEDLWSVLFKYSILEFENIKLLFGIDLGYQNNNININYDVKELQSIKEKWSSEIDTGRVITDDFKNQCNAGFTGGVLGSNIVYNETLDKYVVVGEGVFCNYWHYSEKEVISNKNNSFLQMSLPVSFNFTVLYKIYNNIDLGLSAGLTTVQNLNVSYSNNFISVYSKSKSSSYSFSALINFSI